MAQIVDFHAHIFPNPVERVLPLIPKKGPLAPYLSQEMLDFVRRSARQWLTPVADSMHKAQVFMRHLPETARNALDQVGGLASVPRLFIESTPSDLIEAMDLARVDRAVVIAHPPICSNEYLLEAAQENPQIIPCVNVPPGTYHPGQALKKYVASGARALKIHAAYDGEGVDSTRYHSLIQAAADLGIPVILHTGCIQNRVFYKNPKWGKAELFAPWFEQYSSVQFVLAHMNFHAPMIALDLAQKFENVHVDTSWQPAEIIGEAVRRIGSERVLLGTDWPLVGDNMRLGTARVQEALDAGIINAEDSEKILGLNALRLLRLDEADAAGSARDLVSSKEDTSNATPA